MTGLNSTFKQISSAQNLINLGAISMLTIRLLVPVIFHFTWKNFRVFVFQQFIVISTKVMILFFYDSLANSKINKQEWYIFFWIKDFIRGCSVIRNNLSLPLFRLLYVGKWIFLGDIGRNCDYRLVV